MEPNTKMSASSHLVGMLTSPLKHVPQTHGMTLGGGTSAGVSTSFSVSQSQPRTQNVTTGQTFISKIGLPVSKHCVNLPNITPVSSDQRPIPVLQNVVGTVNLCCELDLLKINTRTRNSEYNPARFSGVVMRIREPRTTALLFHSGKIVITGARSEAECNLAARKYARIIQKLGFPAKFVNFRVTNMVATCDLKFPIRVESLNMMHGQFSSYEPELFPGLIYRMVHPRVVLLIFCNGKICFTGAKTQEELHEALDNIFPILKSFKKQ